MHTKEKKLEHCQKPIWMAYKASLKQKYKILYKIQVR